MLDKRTCVLVSVLIVFSVVNICHSDPTDRDHSPAVVDLNVDSLIKYLFPSSETTDRIEYGTLKSFVVAVTDQLLKSNKYDNSCLKDKLNKLANSLPSQQRQNADDDKFRNVSSVLVASVNSCLTSSKLSNSNNDSHSHSHDHDHEHDHDHDHESGHVDTAAIEQQKHASQHSSKPDFDNLNFSVVKVTRLF